MLWKEDAKRVSSNPIWARQSRFLLPMARLATAKRAFPHALTKWIRLPGYSRTASQVHVEPLISASKGKTLFWMPWFSKLTCLLVAYEWTTTDSLDKHANAREAHGCSSLLVDVMWFTCLHHLFSTSLLWFLLIYSFFVFSLWISSVQSPMSSCPFFSASLSHINSSDHNTW